MSAGRPEAEPVKIDLHLHSTASDGSLSPSAVVWAAAAGGLTLVALTDHDTVSGYAEARAATPPALRLLPGIEVSSTHAGTDLHILGYLFDPAHPALSAHAAAAGARRQERMRGMVRRLQEQGIAVEYRDVLAAAGSRADALGRPHLARALLARGHVRTVAEAFDRFLADGGPAFLPTELLTPRAAIDLIHEAGGVAVWAHPPLAVFDREVRRFTEWGLDGVEAIRPQTPPAEQLLLLEAARELGLLVTGGSDWHGSWHGRLGEFFVRPHEISAFLARAKAVS